MSFSRVQPQRSRGALVSVLLLALLAGSTLLVGTPSLASTPALCPTGGSDPVTTWTSYGHDLKNTRFNTLEQRVCLGVTSALNVSWRFSAGGAITGTPIAKGGMIYFGTWKGVFWAINATTGARVWNATVGAQIDSTAVISNGIVYFGDGNATLHALDAATGAPIWSRVTDTFTATHLWGSPVVVNGMVITGVASDQEDDLYTGPLNFRGSIVAYNATTGALVWRTYLAANGTTGAAVWSTPAVDLASNALFAGTGNAYTAPAGPLTDSMISLNLSTGAIRWSHQFVAGDVSTESNQSGPDSDFGASPNLMIVNGQLMVGEAAKNGFYHLVFASNGTQLWHSTLASGGQFSPGSASVGHGIIVQPYAGGRRVMAFNKTDGHTVWQKNVTNFVYSPTSQAQGLVLYAEGGTLHMDNELTGATVWSGAPGGTIDGGAAIAYGRVYVGTIGSGFTATDGKLVCLTPS